MTAIMRAVCLNQTKMLVEAGADLSLLTKKGKTCLHFCRTQEIRDYLLETIINQTPKLFCC